MAELVRCRPPLVAAAGGEGLSAAAADDEADAAVAAAGARFLLPWCSAAARCFSRSSRNLGQVFS